MHSQQASGASDADRTVRAGGLPAGALTLVFTDIEGSTRLLRQLGPHYGELLAAHNRIVHTAVRAHGGRVVRSEGDAFFCVFEEPAPAVAACLSAQLELARFSWPEGASCRVRMGAHTGPAELGGEDYVGLAVHQAARVSDAAHGGQVLVSEATRRLAAVDLPEEAAFHELGRYRLKDFHEPVTLHQLVHPGLPTEFPALRALPAAAHNVPEPTNVFVGRQVDLAELVELVRGHRLVTVLGAGGVGKTRLAAEAAPLMVSAFPDGVWMVELAHLRDGQAVAVEIAAVLGVRAEAGAPIEAAVAEALGAKRLLLLLDNCEHVLGAVAPVVDGLLSSCAGLRVLATSREPLALPGERRYALDPLLLADSQGGGSEAVALFVERARVVAPAFELARDYDAVVEICSRLDGLPLAIELAAARVAAIPAARMAARLDRRFSVLGGARRGRLAHHETLRASIEWSHELLDSDERVFLRRLGVFVGEFELEAAEKVCGFPPLDPDEVIDLLARLVEKSLVQPAGERFLMLESIRAFAREQAEAAGEVQALIGTHLAHYTEVVQAAAARAEGPGQREAYDQLDANLPNIRAAVQRALERADPAAVRLAAALGQYGFIRNRLAEVAQWCIDAAAIPDAPPAWRARALNQAGFALVLMGSPDGGQALVDDGLALARAAGERELEAETLLMAADLRLEADREAEARPLAEAAVKLVRAIGDDTLMARALVLCARAEREAVGPERTAARLAEAMGLFERSGDRRGVARVLLTRAYLWLEAGELEAAAADATRCLEACRELDHPIGAAMARIVGVWVAVQRGQPGAARASLEQSQAIARDCGYRSLMAYCVAAAAALSAGTGDDRRAARLLGALRAANGALGGEGARAIGARLQALRGELDSRLGPELDPLLREGERAGVDGLL